MSNLDLYNVISLALIAQDEHRKKYQNDFENVLKEHYENNLMNFLIDEIEQKIDDGEDLTEKENNFYNAYKALLS